MSERHHPDGSPNWDAAPPEFTSEPTVPSSEHQRLEAEAARLREAVEALVERGCQCAFVERDEKCEQCAMAQAALSSDAGAPLLEEVRELREAARIHAPAVESIQAAKQAALDEAKRLRAESADLRARLERAESWRAKWRRAFRHARVQRNTNARSEQERMRREHERSAAEVRRAVEEEREACAVVAESFERHGMAAVTDLDDWRTEAAEDIAEAIRSRSRGGAEPKPATESDQGKCLLILPNGRCAGCRNCN